MNDCFPWVRALTALAVPVDSLQEAPECANLGRWFSNGIGKRDSYRYFPSYGTDARHLKSWVGEGLRLDGKTDRGVKPFDELMTGLSYNHCADFDTHLFTRASLPVRISQSRRCFMK